MKLRTWLAAACALAPILAHAQGVPSFSLATAIPNALMYSNGQAVQIGGYVLINPNGGSPCVVGVAGCPGLPTPPLTGALSPAPTGQSQYGLTQISGTSDGSTAITGYAVCSILKPGAGSLFYLRGYASAATYVQIYDSATIPADGTLTWKSSGGVLVETITIPAAGDWLRTVGGGTYPLALSAGITACYSSTGGVVKTQLGSAGTNWIAGSVM